MAFSSSRRWLVLMRIFWGIAILATLCLFALALSALYPVSGFGEISSSLARAPSGEILLYPDRSGGLARAGIYQGDILIAVNDIPVSSVATAATILNQAVGGNVALTVRTGSFPERRVLVSPNPSSRTLLSSLGLSAQSTSFLSLIFDILFAFACAAIALFIAWKKWDNSFALFVSLSLVVVLLGASLPMIRFYQTNAALLPRFGLWFMFWFSLLLAFFYLFPSGRFTPRPTFLVIVGLGVWSLLGLFNPNWLPWQWEWQIYIPIFLGLLGTGVYAQWSRYRQTLAQERLQVRWVAFGAVALVIGLLLQTLPTILFSELTGSFEIVYSFLLYPLGFVLKLLLPLSIGVAILRYRLWDIDLVLNRSLVYGSLTLTIIALYIIGVSILSAVFQTANNPVISLIMTGLVAVLFQPLRERLQRGVNQLMFGQRDEPYAVMARLGEHLRAVPSSDAMLPALVETIAHSLKLPYVAVEFQTGAQSERVAYGSAAAHTIRLPMHYQSQSVGDLLVAPRSPDEPLSAADLNLLDTLARQTATIVHAVNLTADLRRSRERLVTAREEERRRIRRDLHDGLGPALAALAMQADMARELALTDAHRTADLLTEITLKAQSAIQDVRRLVYNLRPPALDELGLVSALEQYAASLSSRLNITFDVPTALPPLPAATEVAAYRIVQEALNNVTRHARAQKCAVRITLDDNLRLEICDDGMGIRAGARSGVGMTSMRERAAELGGACQIESVPGNGTRVTATLPLMQVSVQAAELESPYGQNSNPLG